jgi:oxygen-independent coproporphyrinogen-3 oxidase
VRSWDAYRDHVAAGRLPTEDEETVDAETGGLERAWLLLRTDQGWPMEGAGDGVLRLAEGWTERGLARVMDGRLRLTAEGWLLLDTLAVQMATAAEADAGAAALTG